MGNAKDIFAQLQEETRPNYLEHLAGIQRLLQTEIDELKVPAGLNSCCVCFAIDTSPILRLAEDDESIPGFISVGDLVQPPAGSHFTACRCTDAYLCPACFGRQRVSIVDRHGRIFDSVSCPICRSKVIFETRQAEVDIRRCCDPRILRPGDRAASMFPGTVRCQHSHFDAPAPSQPCVCRGEPDMVEL